MNSEEFLFWLITDKQLTERSSKDVISRLKRIVKLTQKPDIENIDYETFINSQIFLQQSMFIKSQLKRVFILYLEFGEEK